MRVMPCVLGKSQDARLKQTMRRGLAQFRTWPTANRLQHPCHPAALLKIAQQIYAHLFSWFYSTTRLPVFPTTLTGRQEYFAHLFRHERGSKSRSSRYLPTVWFIMTQPGKGPPGGCVSLQPMPVNSFAMPHPEFADKLAQANLTRMSAPATMVLVRNARLQEIPSTKLVRFANEYRRTQVRISPYRRRKIRTVSHAIQRWRTIFPVQFEVVKGRNYLQEAVHMVGHLQDNVSYKGGVGLISSLGRLKVEETPHASRQHTHRHSGGKVQTR